ncbi:MAG: chemotaxis response regulator protein-glutamate methylesterase [Deltaproteobacteria bacterium]|nr:chemotaxis response regulator protein-glutamate methylesterase [Deltaproteobacteria bacterium]
MRKPIRTLIVDDSALVRRLLRQILDSDPAIEVMGTAGDPLIAARKMTREVPDVVLLDVEMPRMSGLEFLEQLMSQHPIPVVICSSHTSRDSQVAFDALRMGAVEIIEKPKVGTAAFIEESRLRLCDAVKAASRARLGPPRADAAAWQPRERAMVSQPPPAQLARAVAGYRNVVLGASTGGTEAIRGLLTALPAQSPPIAIVQHMPEHFTRMFARNLDELSELEVREAATGDLMRPGRVYIAPGNRHLELRRRRHGVVCQVRDGPLVRRHRPSVDVLFQSAADSLGAQALGILLTGMGDDGARGLQAMHEAGARTLAQDEQSSVVFGMPAEAIRRGAVDRVISLHDLARCLLMESELSGGSRGAVG